MKQLRIILIVLSVLLLAIPALIVSISGNGFGELTAKVLISSSISLLIGAVLIGINKANKAKLFTKIGIGIGLLIALLSQWI